MSQTSNSWVGCCVGITIVIGIITLLISPILGIIVTIIACLTIGIMFILRHEKEQKVIPEPSDFFPPYSEPSDLVENAGANHSESVRVRVLDADTLMADSKTSEPELEGEGQSETEVEKLQRQIIQLEKRIKLLKEQLAKEPFAEPSIEPTTPDSIAPAKAELECEEELTVVAIQHLLETLDEKFAKRAISDQLYNRLRDKYLARMEKARRRSEISSNRGSKKDQNR